MYLSRPTTTALAEIYVYVNVENIAYKTCTGKIKHFFNLLQEIKNTIARPLL